MPHHLSTTPGLSYWERRTFTDGADVAIIGSGIVGLTAAIHLRETHPDLRVLVLERGALPTGASTRNAGFACIGSMTELLDDLRTQSSDEVWGLVAQRWDGLQRLRSRLGDAALRYEACGNWELFRPDDETAFAECADHRTAFNRLLKEITGMDDTFVEDSGMATKFGGVTHTLCNRAEGLLHTGHMMEGLLHRAQALGVRLLNGVAITAVEPHAQGVQLLTAAGWVLDVPKVLVATNGFARQLLPDLDVQPARNQVLITKPLARLPFQGGFHYDRGYYYFRHIDGRILIGGGRNLDPQGEQTADFGHTPRIQEALLRLLREVVAPGSDAQPDYWWSGILGVGVHKRPILQRLGPHLAVAVRMGGMGVAIGSLVGEAGAGMVVEGGEGNIQL